MKSALGRTSVMAHRTSPLRLRFAEGEVTVWTQTQDVGEARETLPPVYQILDRVPADERIAFALRHIDGMELSEVAGACAVSLATIKRRIERADQRFLKLAKHHPLLAAWVEGSTRWQDR